MRGEQDGAASQVQRLAQMLEAGDARESREVRIAAPPGHRRLTQAHPQGLEVFIEYAFALRLGQLRQAQRQVAPRHLRVVQRQAAHQPADHAAHPQQQRVGQQLDQAHQAQSQPGGPVTRPQESQRNPGRSGRRGRVRRRDVHGGVGPWLTRTKSPGLIHFLNTPWTSCGVSSM